MGIQFTLALRYLQGRKLRTTLTTLAIVFGVMILFGLGSLIPTMTQVFRQDVMTSSGKVDLAVTHLSAGTFGVDRLDAVRSVDGIAESTASLRQTASLPPNLNPTSDPSKALSSVTVVGLDPASAPSVRSYPLVNGRFLEKADDKSMVMPESLARQLGLAAGSHLTLPSAEGTAQFTIVGIVGTRALPGTAEVYIPLAAAQRLLNQPSQVNIIEALFASGADRAKVEAAVRARLGDGYTFTPMDDGSSVFAGAIDVGGKAMSMIGLLALIMGGFIIFNTFRTVVAERRHDLGMLRALGATRRTILGLILAEGLIQGVIGTTIGLLAGYGLALLAVAALNPVMLQYWNRQLGAPPVTPGNLITAIVLGIGITVVAGLLPAFSATKVSPLEALRPSVAGVETRGVNRSTLVAVALIVIAALTLVAGNNALGLLGALLFLIGLVMLAPMLVKPLANIFGRLLQLIFAREGGLATGNITRQPGRAAITASAVMIALAILIAMAGLLSSIFDGVLSYSDKSLGADYLVMPSSLVLSGGNVGAGPALADQIRNTPGIGAVTTLRLATGSVHDKSLQMVGIDPVSYSQVAGLVFTGGKEKDAYAALAAERAIIVNGIFGAQNRVKVGDVLPVQTAEGMQNYRVVGIGLDFLNAKIATGYISQANLAQDFHQTSDVLLMANRASGVDAGAVRAKLETLVVGYPAFALMDSSTFRSSQQRTFQAMSVMLSILMTTLAAPGLIAMINTLAINVIERTREIGMLRAMGSTRRQVRRIIQAESLLLAALGTAFGILAGLWLGYALVGSINMVGFVVSYEFPYTGLLIGIAAGLLLGVLAATLPARQAAKMDIIEALRYE